jgi:hypothetical protein
MMALLDQKMKLAVNNILFYNKITVVFDGVLIIQ